MDQPGEGDGAGGFDVLTFNRYNQAAAIARRAYSGTAAMVVRRIMPRSGFSKAARTGESSSPRQTANQVLSANNGNEPRWMRRG